MLVLIITCAVLILPYSVAQILQTPGSLGLKQCNDEASFPFRVDLNSSSTFSNATNLPNNSVHDYLEEFRLLCDTSQANGSGILRLPLSQTNALEVREVNVNLGYVRVLMPALYTRCLRKNVQSHPINLHGTPYVFSDTYNKLTVIGCDALVRLTSSSNISSASGVLGGQNTTGCASFCFTTSNVINDECSGVGCCKAALPVGLKSFQLDFTKIRDSCGTLNSCKQSIPYHGHANDKLTRACFAESACNRVFIMDDSYKFKMKDLQSSVDPKEPRQVVLEWWIGNQTCEEAAKITNSSSFMCGKNTKCINSPNVAGYRCNCSDGFSGNPYTKGGCQDINECQLDTSPCVWKCSNSEGGFECHCPPWKTGDGKRDGSGCRMFAARDIGLGVGVLFLAILLLGSIWGYLHLKGRIETKLKEKFFKQNGGLLLQQQISSCGAAARIFSIEELELATDGFSKERIVGQGGYGTVYKGIWFDKTIAIKKAKAVDEDQIEQFINEVVILSQINHKNVVELLGCCLESQVPMLVYEFISNGTLFHHLHEKTSQLSWKKRLQIAEETATALAYLHAAASMPVIHRDVKSANILLDEDYTAKVSDFGASRLVPCDQTHVTTLVQGTMGYLDPEYFYNSQLTDKSDVYSFGVVLAELLIREMPVSMSRSQGERNLSSYFVHLVDGNRLIEVLDGDTIEEAGVRHLNAVANLAKRCMSVKGEERPTMRAVAIELNALRRLAAIEFVEPNQVGKQKLLHSPTEPHSDDTMNVYDPEIYLSSS